MTRSNMCMLAAPGPNSNKFHLILGVCPIVLNTNGKAIYSNRMF